MGMLLLKDDSLLCVCFFVSYNSIDCVFLSFFVLLFACILFIPTKPFCPKEFEALCLWVQNQQLTLFEIGETSIS